MFTDRSNMLMFVLLCCLSVGHTVFAVEATCSDACSGGGPLVINEETTITSANYPSNYSDSLACLWSLQDPTGQRQQQVQFNVNVFEVEFSSTCSYDYLEIFDGTDATGALLGRLCGSISQLDQTTFTSSGPSMFVQFITDSSINRSGFSADVIFVEEATTVAATTVDPCANDTGEIISGPTCGVPAIQPNITRIIGGDDVVPNSWPWQVSLQVAETRSHFCGGSIIGNQWVITAAHCAAASIITGPDSFVVVISEHDFNTDGNEEVYTVEDYYVHPNYSSSTIDNDIALIKLSSEIVFRDEASPVCLAETPVPDGTRCTVTGWGRSSPEGENDVYPNILQQAESYTVNQDICRDPDWNGDGVTDNMFCAGVVEGGVGVCYGDSGGPFVCRHEDTWFLQGLVSWGRVCAGAQKPGVFTRVLNYLGLISYITEGGAFPSRNCGSLEDPMLFTESSGIVVSSGYDFNANYFDNSLCVWRIEVPNRSGQTINLQFVDMDIEPSSTCGYDSLTVYDGFTTNDASLGSFCGSTLPGALTSQGNTMLLVFRSDGSVNRRGFKVSYTSSGGSTGGLVCGNPSITAPPAMRIVGGTAAVKGIWPWQVEIKNYGSHWCGGSVVNPHWIISAAHCFDCAPSCPDKLVVVGEHDRTVEEGTEQEIQISEVIRHENYNSATTENDIVLLRLAEDLVFNDYVSPVCVAGTVVPDDLDCVTTGWGNTEGTSDENILQQVDIPTISQEVCNRDLYPGKITDSMLCAGYLEGGRDSCQGDSGGPLVCKIHDNWFLHGITSWGYGCAEPNNPGVYARVSNLADWILQNTGGEVVPTS